MNEGRNDCRSCRRVEGFNVFRSTKAPENSADVTRTVAAGDSFNEAGALRLRKTRELRKFLHAGVVASMRPEH